LKGRAWLVGERPTIADFSIGAFVPSAVRLGLPVARFCEIDRWYEDLAALPGWRDAVTAQQAAIAAWLATNSDRSAAVELAPISAGRP
jgi:glutathione S-transferase